MAAAAGVIMTGIFANDKMSGSVTGSQGWLQDHWVQVAKQLAGIGLAAGWSAAGTGLLLFGLDKMPFLGGIRVTAEEEDAGLDQLFHGEDLYQLDEVSSESERKHLVVVPKATGKVAPVSPDAVIELRPGGSTTEMTTLNAGDLASDAPSPKATTNGTGGPRRTNGW
jgi:hypothetical protein